MQKNETNHDMNKQHRSEHTATNHVLEQEKTGSTPSSSALASQTETADHMHGEVQTSGPLPPSCTLPLVYYTRRAYPHLPKQDTSLDFNLDLEANGVMHWVVSIRVNAFNRAVVEWGDSRISCLCQLRLQSRKRMLHHSVCPPVKAPSESRVVDWITCDYRNPATSGSTVQGRNR